jgi:hypothetical protein
MSDMDKINKEQLLDALYSSIPYLIDSAAEGDHTDSHILGVIRKIHRAIALLEDTSEGNN